MDNAVVSVLMGGALLDYRPGDADHGTERIDVLVIMGGLVVIVPPDWNVRVEAEVAMSGIRDVRAEPRHAGGDADLVIAGRVVMGGLQIRDVPIAFRNAVPRSS